MSPSIITVNEGEKVVLKIRTDRPVDFYIQGIVAERTIYPSRADNDAVFIIRVNDVGQFEVKDGQAGERLGVLIVKLPDEG